MGRRERRRMQLLDELKKQREDWILKEEQLHRAVWRVGLGRGCGPVVRHTAQNNDVVISFSDFRFKFSKPPNCFRFSCPKLT